MLSLVQLESKKVPRARASKGASRLSIVGHANARSSESSVERGRQALDMIRDSQSYIPEIANTKGLDHAQSTLISFSHSTLN